VERRGVYRVVVEKRQGRISLGRPKRRWEDNIRLSFANLYVGLWKGMSWLRIGTGGWYL
jgi:hypothetical protein